MTIKSKSYNAREPKPRDVEALVITSAIFFGGVLIITIVAHIPNTYSNYSGPYKKAMIA